MALLGVTDLPISGSDDNLLGTEHYINGLVEFILSCSTPMSVALQGDWGSGKTSFINIMKDKLDSIRNDQAPRVKTVYFNTWQYSQFKMSGDLYTAFIVSINSVLSNGSTERLARMLSAVVSFTKMLSGMVTGADAGQVVDAVLSGEIQRTKAVDELKNGFAELIHDFTGDDPDSRIVIFVDDLDRLSPEIAVELLEVMKLFMDVQQCIFVLAIDYDVVVKGIRNKYGADMSEEKCKSFFDKIIQLPFSMPVDHYDLQRMVEKTFGEDISPFSRTLTDQIAELLGSNPRAVKRLFNSYELLNCVHKSIRGNKLLPYESAVVIASLALQMKHAEASRRLTRYADSSERLLQYLTETVGSEPEADAAEEEKLIQQCTISFWRTAQEIARIADAQERPETFQRVLNALASLLKLTAVTEVSPAPPVIRDDVRPSAVQVLGKVIPNIQSIPTALLSSYEELFRRYSDRSRAYYEQEILQKKRMKDYKSWVREKKEERFLQVVALETPWEDLPKIVIGEKGVSNAELAEDLNEFCRYLGLPANSVQWFAKELLIFANT